MRQTELESEAVNFTIAPRRPVLLSPETVEGVARERWYVHRQKQTAFRYVDLRRRRVAQTLRAYLAGFEAGSPVPQLKSRNGDPWDYTLANIEARIGCVTVRRIDRPEPVRVRVRYRGRWWEVGTRHEPWAREMLARAEGLVLRAYLERWTFDRLYRALEREFRVDRKKRRPMSAA